MRLMFYQFLKLSQVSSKLERYQGIFFLPQVSERKESLLSQTPFLWKQGSLAHNCNQVSDKNSSSMCLWVVLSIFNFVLPLSWLYFQSQKRNSGLELKVLSYSQHSRLYKGYYFTHEHSFNPMKNSLSQFQHLFPKVG